MESIITIQDYVVNRLTDVTQEELAKHLGVTKCMVSKYKNGLHTPSLSTAIEIYKRDGVVIHPFSEQSLLKEIRDEYLH